MPFYSTNENVSGISIWPRNPSAEVGFRFVKVYVAAGLKQLFGDYFVEFRRNSSNPSAIKWVSEIPSFRVNITTEKCKVDARQTIYDLPLNGSSLPIIFDFSECMPLNSISITASFDQQSGRNLTFLGGGMNLTKQVVFNQDNLESNNRVLFIALARNTSARVGNIIQVNFNITGANAGSYLIPSPVTIRIVDPLFFSNTTKGAAPLVSISSVSRLATYTFSCSQPSLIYYIYGLDKLVLNVTLPEEIKNNTLNRNIERTELNKLDLSWTIMGFAVQEVKDQLVRVSIDGLRSQGSYNLRYYCGDLLGNYSAPADTNFSMIDNGARYSIASLTFTGQVLASQQLQLVCSLLKMFAVKRERIVTEYGGTCPLSDYPIEKSSNSNTTKSYRFYFLPDYQVRNDTLWINANDVFFDKVRVAETIMANTEAGPTGFPTLQNVSYSIVGGKSSSGITPRIQSNISLYNLTTSTVMMSFTLLDTSGYVFAGIGFPQNKKPSIHQLKNGVDGNGLQLRSFAYGFGLSSSTITLNISGLTDGTNYAVYYGAINDEPSWESLGTDVSQLNFTTRLAAAKSAARIQGLVAVALLAILYVFMN
jgi:hypothetical protein